MERIKILESSKRFVDITFIIINKCNFSCNYCTYPERNSKNFFLDKKEKIISFLENLSQKNENVNLNILITGGEPLLHKDFNEIVEFLLPLKNIEKITITSNGFLIKNAINRIDVFKNKKVEFYITYHYDEYLKFDKTDRKLIENLKFLEENEIKFKLNFLIPTDKNRFKEFKIKKENIENNLKLTHNEFQLNLVRENQIISKKYEKEVLDYYEKYKLPEKEVGLDITFIDGNKIKNISSKFLIKNGLHKFKGYDCYPFSIPTNIFIYPDLQVSFAGCDTMRKHQFRIEEAINQIKENKKIICKTSYCTCVSDLYIKKELKENDDTIKRLLYQKKYPRFKHLFAININNLTKENILNIKKLPLEDSKYSLKTHKINTNFNDSFYKNIGYIIFSIEDLENLEQKIRTLKLLNYLKIEYKVLYKVELDKKYFENKLFKFIDNEEIILLIQASYSKKDIKFVKDNIIFFRNKDIFLSLEYIKKQEDIKSKNLFEIIKNLEKKDIFVNTDFIRFESASKGLYVIGPKELHLDLFEACNASCNFCATNGAGLLKNNENKFKQQFQAEIYLSLFKKIREAQTNSIALGMTGEPFLHKEIGKIIEGLGEIDINIGFLTNGYKLLENIKYIIKNKNIKHFYINISAGNIESFNGIRPKDNFENFLNVWKAIKILKIKRPDILVRGLYVITPQNICGIEDFLKLAIRNEIGEIELKRVIPYEHSKDYLYFSKDDIIKVKNIISKFIGKITIKNNFESTLEEFDNILTGKILQYTLEVNNEAGKTKNCYNPYFYINILRTSSYTCCKFITKIGKLSNLDLYTQLFDNNNISNIIYGAEDLEKLLGTERWKNNCNICQDMDTNNMVSEYIKLKNIGKRF